MRNVIIVKLILRAFNLEEIFAIISASDSILIFTLCLSWGIEDCF